LWRDNVSGYAGYNADEAFVESFAAWTSPLYGTEGKVLSQEIVTLFKEWFE
jgi:hypothetical protein|tara:strand:- start:266 stop:418 length:153 start_codon:yes stop_codon:yes gene_type:complete